MSDAILLQGDKKEVDGPVPLPSVRHLCLDLPLYTYVPLEDVPDDEVSAFARGRHRLECFCGACQAHSIFHNEAASGPWVPHAARLDRDIWFTFTCARSSSHQLNFWFRIRDHRLFKVGQHPSHADLATSTLNKYRKFLGDDAKEFSKAIGLAAHGVGIGSFVYLRRIIENLVEEVHKETSKAEGWDEVTYANSRFSGKMEILSGKLPTFLAENPSIYKILSKGIHELEEEECLECVPVLKIAIELILDEKIVAKEKSDKITFAKTQLGKLSQKHSSSSQPAS